MSWLVRIHSRRHVMTGDPDWCEKSNFASPWAAIRSVLDRMENEVGQDWTRDELTITVDQVR